MTRLLRFVALLVPALAYAQSYEGNLDPSDCSVIGGWAADANNPNTAINVDIYDGSTYITTTLANAYRRDLGFVGYYHGFTITTPASLKNNEYHYINAMYGGTHLLLPSSNQALYCSATSTGYQYYFSDVFSSDFTDNLPINTSAWSLNGSPTLSSAGLTSSATNGGSVISKITVPSPSSEYEVKATLTLTGSGGSYALYTEATSNALYGPSPTGTAYIAELQNVTFTSGVCSGTLVVYRQVNGAITQLTSTTWSCHNGMTIRFVYAISNQLAVYVDNQFILWAQDSTISPGQPGVAVRGAPSTNGIARVDLGPHDGIAPTAVNSQLISSSSFPTHVDLHWVPTVDDSNGTGVAFYQVYRNGTLIGTFQTPNLSDTGVSTPNTYTYTVAVFDYHLNVSSTAFLVTMPPAGSIDPRQVGVRPLGSYWGGAGEQIDMRSGNMNYTMPLIKAQARGGWSVGFNLSYNSQNWRNDPAGVWELGRDTGYGYGWRLQAGSLTPIYNGYWTIGYWQFIDGTGAEYRLDQSSNNGTIWTSLEGIYLTFDAAGRLYFPDGSFWVFGDLSAGTEQDAGTYYPTLIEDTNGNQIMLTYQPGVGVTYSNSSARIATIEDVRGNGTTDYTFTYNTDTIPHLTGITNSINTSENYTLAYTASSALIQPFASTSNNNFGTFTFLQSLTVNGPNLTTSFTYIPATDNNTNPPTNGYSGELAQMTTPYGGHLRWAYAQYTLSGTRTFREVQYRYLLMCGASMANYCSANGGNETQHTIFRDPNDSGRTIHSYAGLLDSITNASKAWIFQTDGTQFNAGLQLEYQEFLAPNNTNPLLDLHFTWAQTPSSLNPYVSNTLTTLDYGQSYQAQKMTTQTLDQYGNLLTMQVYDFGNLSTPARFYNNTYLTDSNFTSRHITNRLTSSTVANGSTCSTATQCTTLVSNAYEGAPYVLTDLPGVHEHDASYNTSFIYRGMVTSSTTPAATKVFQRDIGGNVTSSTVNGVYTTVSSSSTTNYAAPSQMTTNSLSSNMNWTGFFGLSSVAGPNGDTASFGYTNGRPTSTTSPYGGTTSYTYADSVSPPYKTATTNGHWVQTAMDGFGRTIQTETGYSGTGVSVTATHYDPCGCSPLGKVSQVTEPFAPGGSVYWTNYTYDASGRTTKIALPDSSATIYLYQGNTVKVTDPAGKAKTFTMDAFGNLKQVAETDPSLGTVTTTYTYDILNHLTQVSMPRGSNTQTRTFNYIASGTNTVGAFLLTATNPENGTVTYTYSNNLMASKTDAKGQAFTYQYDNYNRLYKVFVGGSLLRTYFYDTDPAGYSAFSQYGLGRLTAVQYAPIGPVNTGTAPQITLTDRYSYIAPGQPGGGLPAIKRLLVSEILYWQSKLGYPENATVPLNLDATYTHNNEGKITAMTYPTTTSNGAGLTYNYSYDSMYRLSGMTDSGNNALVNNVSYAPSNQMLTMNYRTNSYNSFTGETRGYNTMFQLTSLTAGNLSATYNYPSGTNNGKMSSSVINGETVTYQYDSLNRLISAASSAGWGEAYGFDGFGNLTTKTPTAGSAPTLAVNVNASTNQMQGVYGLTYDNNGNELYGGITYDPENRIATVPGLQYSYDAQNKRIWSWNGTLDPLGWGNASGYSLFLYAPGGQRLGTYQITVFNNGQTDTNLTLQSAMVTSDLFFGSRRLGVVEDRLGSVGSYFPYGEARPGTNPLDTWSFASYWRDSATGMTMPISGITRISLGGSLRRTPQVV